MERAIRSLNSTEFSAHLQSWVEVVNFLNTQGVDLKNKFDILKPTRGEIPTLSKKALEKSASLANDAILAFSTVAALTNNSEAISKLESEMKKLFGKEFPSLAIFENWHAKRIAADTINDVVEGIISVLQSGRHTDPSDAWGFGLRIFEKFQYSIFKAVIIPVLARWLRTSWKRILAEESFRLKRPIVTAPPIEAALRIPDDDERFIAVLLLASADSVGVSLASEYQRRLEQIANRTSREPSTS